MRRLQRREPEWLTLIEAADGEPAVRIKMPPITRAMRRRAAAAAQGIAGGAGLEDGADDPLLLIEAGEAVSMEMIRIGLLECREWEGIGGADGTPLPVTEDNVEMFLADDELFAAADAAYVRPWVDRELEKKDYAASPNGIGEAATAERAIAGSSAGRGPGKAARPRKGAKSARTGSTRSAAAKAKRSGTS